LKLILFTRKFSVLHITSIISAWHAIDLFLNGYGAQLYSCGSTSCFMNIRFKKLGSNVAFCYRVEPNELIYIQSQKSMGHSSRTGLSRFRTTFSRSLLRSMIVQISLRLAHLKGIMQEDPRRNWNLHLGCKKWMEYIQGNGNLLYLPRRRAFKPRCT